MPQQFNDFGQPIGPALPEWTPPPTPSQTAIEGRYCRLEPLDPCKHASELWEAICEDPDVSSWTYLPSGPFPDFEEYQVWVQKAASSSHPLFFAIRDLASDRACGVASYLRITPASGSIEVGHIHFSRSLRRTPAATEAMYLLMERAFSLGFRRYEWKCDALNAPSRAAAQRLGFTFEGIFRQATVYKGRSRDTAWYSLIDTEWPGMHEAFRQWLDPANFDASGNQRLALSELTGSAGGPDSVQRRDPVCHDIAFNTCLQPDSEAT